MSDKGLLRYYRQEMVIQFFKKRNKKRNHIFSGFRGGVLSPSRKKNDFYFVLSLHVA